MTKLGPRNPEKHVLRAQSGLMADSIIKSQMFKLDQARVLRARAQKNWLVLPPAATIQPLGNR